MVPQTASLWEDELAALDAALHCCNSKDPQLLRQQLAVAQARIELACDRLVEASRGKHVLLMPSTADGSPNLAQLLIRTFRLLRLSTSASAGSPNSRSLTASASNWTKADATGVRSLLYIIVACLQVICFSFEYDTLQRPSRSAAASFNRALMLVADSQPCAAMASALTMRIGIWSPASPASPALNVAIRLLHTAAVVPPLAAALLPELQSTGLTSHVCECLKDAVVDPVRSVEASAAVDKLFGAMSAAFQSTMSISNAPLAGLLFNMSDLAYLLLAAIKQWGRGLDLQSQPGHGTLLPAAVSLLRLWLRSRHEFEGGSQGLLSSATHSDRAGAQALVRFKPCAEHVSDIVHATGRHPMIVESGAEAVNLLWRLLDEPERHRAFAPVAQLSLRMVAGVCHALSQPAAQGGADCRSPPPTPACGSTPSGTAAARALRALSRAVAVEGTPEECARVAMAALDEEVAATATHMVLLMGRFCALSCDGEGCAAGGQKNDSETVKRLQKRAEWLLRGNALVSCEAMLRATSWRVMLPTRLQTGLADASFLLALTLGTLVFEGQHRAPALAAAVHSVVVSVRKRLFRSSPLPAARKAQYPGQCPLVEHERSAGQGSTSVDEGGPSISGAVALMCNAALLSVTRVLHAACTDRLLLSRCEVGCAQAQLLQQAVVLQVLPMAVQAAAAAQRARVPRVWWAGIGRYLLEAVAAANTVGLAALTAATGGPRLLSVLLSTAHQSSPGDPVDAASVGRFALPMAALCVVALSSAVSDPTWAAEARRLKLASRAKALLKVRGPPHRMPGSMGWTRMGDDVITIAVNHYLTTCTASVAPHTWPAGSGLVLSEAVLHAAAQLCEQVEGCSQVASPSAVQKNRRAQQQLHEGMLDLATQPCTGTGKDRPHKVAPFMFGCWSLRCTNLGGASEATLKTSTCGGCQHARYCSVECQRRAWRSGHREACHDWQATHAVSRSDWQGDVGRAR